MPPKLKKFVQTWAINTLAVLLASYILRKGIYYEKAMDLLMASLLLGILNAVFRPILFFFSLPLVVLTAGLFMLVINAMLLYFVSWLLRPGFEVKSFGYAFLGALIIGIVSLILNGLTGTDRKARIQVRRFQDKGRSEHDDDGPVIDV